jgi:hypothetical protein
MRGGRLQRLAHYLITVVCACLLIPGSALSAIQVQQVQPTTDQGVKIPADQLDSLVAPIALYPDPMLSQTLVASTYPLELMQLQQWLERNKGLKDQALLDAVQKEPWDPSIKAMAGLPDLVNRLANDIQWTTDLGNAFLAQQSDVMDAVQRMRAKAQGTGALTSNEQQKVESQVIEDKSVIVIEQADPEVVYVPSYNPESVYGPPAYPYPAISYPPYYGYGGVWAASAISFGVGVAMGAFWGGGGWGWGAGWGGNDIDINRNNNFNRNTNISGGDRTWRHNPEHRGGAPYRDRATANRFGSNTRGDSLTSRQQGARQQISRQKGNLSSVRDPGVAQRRAASSPGGVHRGNMNRGDLNRGTRSPGASGNFGGANRVGNRSVGSGSSYGNRGGFSGGSGGYSGRSARASSSRGSSSLGSSRRSSGGYSGSRGGGSRGGGGRGGGGRGGGGRGGGRR